MIWITSVAGWRQAKKYQLLHSHSEIVFLYYIIWFGMTAPIPAIMPMINPNANGSGGQHQAVGFISPGQISGAEAMLRE